MGDNEGSDLVGAVEAAGRVRLWTCMENISTYCGHILSDCGSPRKGRSAGFADEECEGKQGVRDCSRIHAGSSLVLNS